MEAAAPVAVKETLLKQMAHEFDTEFDNGSAANAGGAHAKDKNLKRRRLRTLHCYFARGSLSAAAASATLPCGGLQLEVLELDEDAEAVQATAAAVSPAVGSPGRWRWLSASELRRRSEWKVVSFPDAAGWLREAIGPPPRRPLNEPEPNLLLLFSGDLGIICAVAGIALLVSAFTVENGGQLVIVDDASEAAFALMGAAATDAGKRVQGSSRTTWMVVCLSALAGGALNFQHAIRNALLCGL